MKTDIPVFGTPRVAEVFTYRPAAYAVLRDRNGRVAAIQGDRGRWLPGGGSRAGESPVDTIRREAMEELGCELESCRPIGEAIQYFAAENENVNYEMHAWFFEAVARGPIVPEQGASVTWIDTASADRAFYHECHDWAARIRNADALGLPD